MVRLRDDNILEIELQLGVTHNVNLNSTYSVMIYTTLTNSYDLVINNEMYVCTLDDKDMKDNVISMLISSKLFHDYYINDYATIVHYKKEESKNKPDNELTKDDFYEAPINVDVFVKSNSQEILTITDTPSYKDEDENIFPEVSKINFFNGRQLQLSKIIKEDNISSIESEAKNNDN